MIRHIERNLAKCLAVLIALAMLAAADAGLAAGDRSIEKQVRVIDDDQRLEQWEGYRDAKEQGRIVYVAGDGSGDFNCDGSDDQVQINEAIEYVASSDEHTIVHLRGPHTYLIGDAIRVHDGTILQGDANAVVKLKDNVQWRKHTAMLASSVMLLGADFDWRQEHPVRDVTIRGFEMDANRGNNRGTQEDTGERRTTGQGWDYMIMLFNAYDIAVYDMYLHSMLTDGIKVRNNGEHAGQPINSRFYNNRIERCGHDGIFMTAVTQFEIFNNYAYDNRTNSQIRVSGGGSDYAIYDNVLRNNPGASYSGNAGIQIQNSRHEVTGTQAIYGNRISRMGLGGIVIYSSNHAHFARIAGVDRLPEFGTQRGFHIHHNIIEDCRMAGIRLYGSHETLIEHNVLHANRGDGILHWYVYGTLPERRWIADPPEGQRYRTIVRNNIIVNTTLSRAHTEVGSYMPNRVQPEAGFGINDCILRFIENPGDVSPHLDGLHEFVVENNCIYNNESGPYNNVESTANNIYQDPMFVDPENRDFRLQSDSPCIGAGTDGGNIGVH